MLGFSEKYGLLEGCRKKGKTRYRYGVEDAYLMRLILIKKSIISNVI